MIPINHWLQKNWFKQESIQSPSDENIHVTDLLTGAGAAAVSKVKVSAFCFVFLGIIKI